jgi:DNA-binding transcriptional LysR family regulator
MDSRLLRRVVTLARVLSYTKAAEQLGISQSVLTRSIQDVEQRAKVRLFDRDRAGVHVTPFGRAFVERATTVLRDADDLDRMLERAAGGTEGKVSFGLEQLHAPALVPSLLADGLATGLGPEVFVAIRRAGALLPLLLNEEIEFFVCTEGALPIDAPVKSAVLGHFPLSLLVRPGHPLIDGNRDVGDRSFPVIASNYFARSAIFPEFFWNYLKSPPRVVVEDAESLCRLTETTDAIWVSSAFTATDAIDQKRLVEIAPPAGEAAGRLRTMCYSLDRRSVSPAALKLQNQMRARLQLLWAAASPPGDRPAVAHRATKRA